MFTFITSLLNRSCNNSRRPYFQENFEWHCENVISKATLLDNPLSILPNSLKKTTVGAKENKPKLTQVFNGPIVQAGTYRPPQAPPQPLRPVSQLEAQ